MSAQVDPPHGCTWGRYVEQLVQEHGGWATLVDLLIRRAEPVVELPADPGSVERGIRRLASRANAPGGQYGRWLLRFFGVPRPLADTARWMGQYHSRFADLPLSLRESQLWLWDRPPICESAVASWVHLGLASVAVRRGDQEIARQRLERAQARAGEDRAARVECALLAARLDSDEGERAGADRALRHADTEIDAMAQGDERDCYRARLLDQLAYRSLHPEPGQARRVDEAFERYASISSRSQHPFVLFRRDHGLAYCHWKRSELAQALAHAQAACTHAGDAGLLRFRVMALGLLARLVPAEERPALEARGRRLVTQLEHEDLPFGEERVGRGNR